MYAANLINSTIQFSININAHFTQNSHSVLKNLCIPLENKFNIIRTKQNKPFPIKAAKFISTRQDQSLTVKKEN